MELTDAVRRRKMVRQYAADPVPPEVVDALLDLARRAPSAGNSQGRAFVVLEAEADRDLFWQTIARPGFEARAERASTAPVVVLAFADPEAYVARYREADKTAAGLADADAWPVPYWLTDTAMAVEHILLGATDRGLGALLFLVEQADRVKAAFGVPAGLLLLGAVTIGWPHPDDRPGLSASRPRRPVADVVHRGRW